MKLFIKWFNLEGKGDIKKIKKKMLPHNATKNEKEKDY